MTNEENYAPPCDKCGCSVVCGEMFVDGDFGLCESCVDDIKESNLVAVRDYALGAV